MKLALGRQPPKPYHGPVYNTTDLAAEFGVSARQLHAMLQAEGAPQPLYRQNRDVHQKRNGYIPEQVRAWWQQRTRTE